VPQASPGRPSWCYGTAGIARALQSAALATGDPGLRQTAEQALAACITDPAQLSQLTDASLCHGWAGLLHTARCAAADAADPALFDLDLLDRELRKFLRTNGMPRQMGLLTGSTGIQLVIENPGHRAPPASAWDHCLLTGTTITRPDTAVCHALTVSEGIASGAIL
jgi:class I lanthipeptide synthase